MRHNPDECIHYMSATGDRDTTDKERSILTLYHNLRKTCSHDEALVRTCERTYIGTRPDELREMIGPHKGCSAADTPLFSQDGTKQNTTLQERVQTAWSNWLSYVESIIREIKDS